MMLRRYRGWVLLAACASFVPGVTGLVARAGAVEGTLDASFSGDGILPQPRWPSGLAVYRDGIFVSSHQPGSPAARIELRSRSGQLVSTFSDDGVATVHPSGWVDTSATAPIASDGGFVLAAIDRFRPDLVVGLRAAVIRLTAAGKYDRSFSGDGRYTFRVGLADEAMFIGGVWSAPNGSVSVLVHSANGFSGLLTSYLLRLRRDGTPVPGFGTNGVLRITAQFESGLGTFLSDGRIYLMASGQLTRRGVRGGLDATFGGDGRVRFPCRGRLDGVRADTRNRPVIVCVGESLTVTAVRLKFDGARDSSFGGDGVAVIDPIAAGVAGSVLGFAVDPFNRVVVVGEGRVAGDTALLVARLRANGELDASFSGDGRAAIVIDSGSFLQRPLSVASDARVYIPGGAGTAGRIWAIDQE